jgi:hypothetical protein
MWFMHPLTVAIVMAGFFSAGCDGDRRPSATHDAGDGARPADVGRDAGADDKQGDGAGTTDAEPVACPMQVAELQACEPVDARCGSLGCGLVSCVCQQIGWRCTWLLCP